MQVVEYIHKNGLQALTDNLSIKVKDYGDLILLDYCQIDSPKFDPIVRECRGVILEKDSLKVVCRSFCRFFNFMEDPSHHDVDFKKCKVYEKVDGSVLRFFHYAGKWNVATRSTAFADTPNAWGKSFKELTMRAMGISLETRFQDICDGSLDKDCTYIFEITSPENRVVKPYEGTTLHFLAVRETATGNYIDRDVVGNSLVSSGFPCKLAEEFKFEDIEKCVATAKAMDNLDKGFVVYCEGIPLFKIKSDLYVTVHLIKGEGLTPKRVINVILENEQEEYLTYFPEDASYFKVYEDGLEKLMDCMYSVWEDNREQPDQKLFALAIKDYPFSGCLFKARKTSGMSPRDAFNEMSPDYKINLIKQYSEDQE